MDASTVIGRASAISMLMQDITQVSESAFLNCSLALVSTIVNNPYFSGLDATVATVTAALSSLLEKGSSMPPDIANKLLTAVRSLAQGRQLSLAVRETATSIVTSNLRITTSLVYAGDLNSTLLEVPVSDIERVTKSSTSVVSVITAAQIYDNVGVTVSQMTRNLHRANGTFSPIVSISFYYYASVVRSEAQITLVNTKAVTYKKEQRLNGTVACAFSSHSYDVTVNCSYGRKFVVTCQANSTGSLRYTCPAYSEAAVCASWNGASYSADSYCETVAYSATNTTCICSNSRRSPSRRLADDEESNPTEHSLTSSALLIGEQFISVWVSAKDLNASTVKKNIIVLVTVCVLLAMLAAGTFGLVAWDRYVDENGKAKKMMKYTQKKRSIQNIIEYFEAVLPVEFTFRFVCIYEC